MSTSNIGRSFKIQGRQAAEDFDEPGLCAKHGSGSEEFQLTTAVDDDLLGYVPYGLGKGQNGPVIPAPGSVVLMQNDGAVSQNDRLALSGTNAGHVTASEDVSDTFVGMALHAANDGEEVLVLWGRYPPHKNHRVLNLTPGSEGDQVSDAFDIGLDQNFDFADRWMVRAYSQDGSRATNIQLSLQDGNGTEVNSSGNDLLIFDLHTDGTETLRALDGSGTLSADVELVFTPLDSDGEQNHETLTFS